MDDSQSDERDSPEVCGKEWDDLDQDETDGEFRLVESVGRGDKTTNRLEEKLELYQQTAPGIEWTQ